MDENEQPSVSTFYITKITTPSVSVIHQIPSHTILDIQRFSMIENDRIINQLTPYGGVPGVADALNTDMRNGIYGNSKDIRFRRESFGTNTYPARSTAKSFFNCFLEELKDFRHVVILACASLSLGLGIRGHGVREGWYTGASIFTGVIFSIFISAIMCFMANILFDKPNNDRAVVVRNGRREQVAVSDIVVGDIVCLTTGDQVPADGLFIEGHSLKVDESEIITLGGSETIANDESETVANDELVTVAGDESETVAGDESEIVAVDESEIVAVDESKIVAVDESERAKRRHHVCINQDKNPYLFSGIRVVDGCGTMLVTAVGMNTRWGTRMNSSRNVKHETPLQARWRHLISIISKVGLAITALVLGLLLVFYFTENTRYNNKVFDNRNTKSDDLMDSVMEIIASSVVILIVLTPRGLTVTVSFALAHSVRRMMIDHAMVRNLHACEAMATATTICTDVRSIVASNQPLMKVTRSFIGRKYIAGKVFTSEVLQHLFRGIKLTSVVNIGNFLPTFQIDEAIYSWAVRVWNMALEDITQFSTLDVKASCSESWRIGVSLKHQLDDTVHLYWKGDAEVVLQSCSHYYDSDGHMIMFTGAEREEFRKIMVGMADKRIRCIAIAHRQLSEVEYVREGIADTGFILLGLIGVEYHFCPGVKETIEICRPAGVAIKLITNESISRAEAILLELGMLSQGRRKNEGAVAEAHSFFNSPTDEQKERVGNIMVMAMSSDDHKLQMVQLLKEEGRVVVIGHMTNDAPILKEADIGITLGTENSPIVKDSADISILDDDFRKVVNVMCWARCSYNNVQKVIQFQLTANLAASVIHLVSIASDCKATLTVAQVLWTNLIMVTLGSLALATDKPTKELMSRPPVRNDSFITKIMWRNITGQALYEITVVLILKFKGTSIFGVHESTNHTFIFTTFLMLQVFNMFNARSLEKKNLFEGVFRNVWFLGIAVMTILLQVVLVEFLNKFAHTKRLDLMQWAACVAVAALSWPFGCLIKCIPVQTHQ